MTRSANADQDPVSRKAGDGLTSVAGPVSGGNGLEFGDSDQGGGERDEHREDTPVDGGHGDDDAPSGSPDNNSVNECAADGSVRKSVLLNWSQFDLPHPDELGREIETFSGLERHVKSFFRQKLEARSAGRLDPEVLDLFAELQSDVFWLTRVSKMSSLLEPDILALSGRLEAAADRIQPDHRKYRELSLGADVLGRAFYSPEADESGALGRWTGPASIASLFVDSIPTGRYVLEGSVRFLSEANKDSFAIALQQGEFHRPVFIGAHPGTLHFSLAVAVKNPLRSTFSTIQFYCERPISPFELDHSSPDKRQLGALIRNLKLTLIDQPE